MSRASRTEPVRRLHRTRALVAVVLSIAVAPIAGHAQDEIVARGNLAYQEGDYVAAIEAYEAVARAGFTSAGLEYNLGNAHFKAGNLGRSILHWERAAALSPGDPDTRANLELARSLTVDAIEPLPDFWLFAALEWWIELVPTVPLALMVALAWLAFTGGVTARILARSPGLARFGRVATTAGAITVVLFGATLFARELDLGRADRAVILVEAVSVRSAPAEDDDLTLFEVHEGTRVGIDQRTGDWVEVVLEDGKVGWIPLDALEVI